MQKVFRVILFVLRFLFGTTFIVSGVLKSVDPVGTGLVVSEYFSSFGMAFLKPVSTGAGVCLSVLELVTGLALLVRLRMCFFSVMAFVMTLFFSAVTFVLYKFNPIQDCGCFGEAIHLSNSQTFYKNLILLLFIIPVFLYRKRYLPVARKRAEWSFIAASALMASALSISLVKTGPLSDFGDFKVGTHIPDKINRNWSGLSDAVYVYEKDGVKMNYLLSEIPDSSWHFVEMIPSGAGIEDSGSFDFAISAASDGRYITDSILNYQGPVALFTVYDPEDICDDDRNCMTETAADLDRLGFCSLIVSSEMVPHADSLSRLFAFSDYKTLISMSRSNGGVVILNSGTVVAKCYRGELSEDDLISLMSFDSDESASVLCVRENILLEMIFVILMLSILLFRYFCGLKRDRSLTAGL